MSISIHEQTSCGMANVLETMASLVPSPLLRFAALRDSSTSMDLYHSLTHHQTSVTNKKPTRCGAQWEEHWPDRYSCFCGDGEKWISRESLIPRPFQALHSSCSYYAPPPRRPRATAVILGVPCCRLTEKREYSQTAVSSGICGLQVLGFIVGR
jgi:hypothetical protein